MSTHSATFRADTAERVDFIYSQAQWVCREFLPHWTFTLIRTPTGVTVIASSLATLQEFTYTLERYI